MILSPTALPIESYHRSAPEWLSKTSIMDFRRMGPAWWKLAHLDRAIERPSPGGVLQGNMLDCYLTEGEAVYRDRYMVAPIGAPKKPDSRQMNAKKPSPETLDAIAYWAPFAGKVIVTQADEAIMRDAVAAVLDLPDWPRISAGKLQHSIRRHSSELGLGLQSRPDILELDLSQRVATSWDLKKTADLDRFPHQALDLGYHLQASIAQWCLAGEGFTPDKAFLIAVEWERGARAKVYEIPTEALEEGFRWCGETVKEISQRLASGDWNYRQAAPEPLPIPTWRARQMAEVA